MWTPDIDWREVESSFIEAIAWVPINTRLGGVGWTLIKIRGTVYAYITPSWVYGLLCSADARHESVGRVYSRVLRGAFPRATPPWLEGGAS